MNLRRSFFACTVGLVLAAPLPAGAEETGPALVIHAQSLDELIGRVKATAKNFLPDQMYQEFEKSALSHLDSKQLPGVDSKRSFGLYASIDAGVLQGDFSKSQVVGLIPVSNEKDFLALIEKAGVKATKQRDETLYALEVPVPLPPNAPPLFLRFSKQYAYLSIGSGGANPKNMLDPKDVLPASEKAAAAIHIHIDRIPKEVKDFILAQIDQAGETIQALPFPPEAKELFDKYMKFAVRMYKQGLQGGKELAYRFDLEPKGGLILDVTATPLPNTELAKSIAAIPKSQNRFASLVGTDSAAHGFLSLPLYVPELKDIFVSLTDLGAKHAQEGLERDQAPKEAQEAAAAAFAALKRTFQAGQFDMAGSLRGPGKDGKFSAIAAVTIKDTAPLEKAIKAGLKVIPAPANNMIKLDAHKVGEHSVHEITVGEMMPKEPQAVFGKASVYLCFGPDAVYVSFGTNGLDLIKEALNSKAGPAPTFTAEVNGKRLAELIKAAAGKDVQDEKAGMWLGLLTKQERIVLLSMEIEGGEKMHMRANYGVLPLVAMGWMTYARSTGFQPPVAVPAKP